MRPLLLSALLLAACTRPRAEAPKAVDAGPPLDDCAFSTPLVPGVPGSPGHLIPSAINPNGASELATLMRAYVDDWQAARQLLEAGLTVAPKLPTHRKLRCSWPTDPNDRNETYDGLAMHYLDAVKQFDAAPSRETYEGVLDRCRACHEVTCGGPLEVIEGLRWKLPR